MAGPGGVAGVGRGDGRNGHERHVRGAEDLHEQGQGLVVGDTEGELGQGVGARRGQYAAVRGRMGPRLAGEPRPVAYGQARHIARPPDLVPFPQPACGGRGERDGDAPAAGDRGQDEALAQGLDAVSGRADDGEDPADRPRLRGGRVRSHGHPLPEPALHVVGRPGIGRAREHGRGGAVLHDAAGGSDCRPHGGCPGAKRTDPAVPFRGVRNAGRSDRRRRGGGSRRALARRPAGQARGQLALRSTSMTLQSMSPEAASAPWALVSTASPGARSVVFATASAMWPPPASTNSMRTW